MRSRSPFLLLNDIHYHILLVWRFVEGYSFETFVKGRRTVYAVTRCLEIVSEAFRRLPVGLKARHPHIQWKKIAGAGSIYRHNYEDVLERFLWLTVHESLEPLFIAVEAELATLAPE